MEKIKNCLKLTINNLILQYILVLIFIIPLISTLEQFITSGFIYNTNSTLIIFWPGVNWNFSLLLPVWLSFGVMATSYVIGIWYMCKKRIFAQVVIIGVSGLIMAQLIGSCFNLITGFKELQQISSITKDGVANRLIFSLWHNPAWEEIVFRGIPLIILVSLKKWLGIKKYKFALGLYFIIPSIAMAIYHIPNHGTSRIVDTLILSVVFAWLSLKYSFFAPLIMHYIFDSIMVINMGHMKGLDQNEVVWLSQNFGLINTSFSIGIITLLIFMALIFIWNMKTNRILSINNV